MMKDVKLKYLLILLAIPLFSLVFISCHNPIIPTPASNNDVLNYKEFYLSAANVSLDTSVQGTIFARSNIEKPEERHVQIAAWVEIDTDDWGGIGFGIPQGWEISSIVSDYPQGNPKPESYITTLHTASDEPFVTFIHIGATKYGAPDLQGGKGSVIIELAPESSEQELPENFQTIIGIGSKYDYIVHPVYETYEVPLNTDYHDVSPYTIHPSPGNYLRGSDLEQSMVALKDVRTETAIADADYFSAWYPEHKVKEGEPWLVVSGHVQNKDKEKFELAMWAEGYDALGNVVARTLDAAHIVGQIGLHLEYDEIGEFTLHLSLPDNLRTIRIFAASYLVTPP